MAISGTPGTGKSELAKKLSKKLNYKIINIGKIVKKNNISESYDKELKSYVVDTKKISKFIINLIKNKDNIILEGHLSHYIPKKYVDLCIMCKCDLKILQKRLEKRKYSKKKIRENLDAEILDICLNEALEAKHNILVIDTSKKINIKYIIEYLSSVS